MSSETVGLQAQRCLQWKVSPDALLQLSISQTSRKGLCETVIKSFERLAQPRSLAAISIGSCALSAKLSAVHLSCSN
jgi:hypothetical protein